jgi:kynurenine formamidase
MALREIELALDGQRFRADLTSPAHLAIALDFDGEQPSFFGAPPARAEPLKAGTFTGDVNAGGSCMCSTYTITPHCNGTHTECVGHVVREPVSIHAIATESLLVARLVTITPIAAAGSGDHSDPPALAGDRWIAAAQLRDALGESSSTDCNALVVRTLPNAPEKRQRHYDADANLPAYFSSEAMRWIVAQGYSHLVVDLPSVDRAADEGKLTCHRIFWGLPPGSTSHAAATRPHATLTELACVDAAVVDGLYLLNLQLAPFATDAAPSRPVLYPLEPAS